MKRRAFTFTEILVVIAIIALLTALLLPFFAAARRQSKQAPCISNLRQFYAAWALYLGDHDDAWPKQVAEFMGTSNAGVLSCPSDTFQPGANEPESRSMGRRVSFFYISGIPEFREDIEKADVNHGIAYCVLHGERKSLLPDAVASTTGLVLRLLRDGSVQRPHVPHMCSDPGPNGWISGRPQWTLLTDAWPCPERWCANLTHPCPQRDL